MLVLVALHSGLGCDAWTMRHRTHGYLPSRRELPLGLGRYSFPVRLNVGG